MQITGTALAIAYAVFAGLLLWGIWRDDTPEE